MKISDTDRIDFLQKIMVDKGTYTKKCILRKSVNGRGFRLHESSWNGSSSNVRNQIDNWINKQNE